MKGILFKPDMIKAIVERRKTVTRRIVKPEPGNLELLKRWCKPRYNVGEVVYIKETLYRHPYLDEAGYMLDRVPVFINQTIGDCLKWRWQKDILGGMFMPQEAARYFIKITSVRPERLQEITEADIEKEGCGHIEASVGLRVQWYKELWDSINPEYSWASNPFVWRYGFTCEDKKCPIA